MSSDMPRDQRARLDRLLIRAYANLLWHALQRGKNLPRAVDEASSQLADFVECLGRGAVEMPREGLEPLPMDSGEEDLVLGIARTMAAGDHGEYDTLPEPLSPHAPLPRARSFHRDLSTYKALYLVIGGPIGNPPKASCIQRRLPPDRDPTAEELEEAVRKCAAGAGGPDD